MQRRDEDTRGMTGVSLEDDSPHARPGAVLEYTVTIALTLNKKE